MTTEELVVCVRGKIRALTAELRSLFIVGQAMRPAEREEKYNGVSATTKQFLSLVRDLTALETAYERAEAAHGRFTERQGA